MKKQFELTYKKGGDYHLPDLGITDHRPFGRWGMLYIKYLEEHHPIRHSHLLLSGKMESFVPDLNEQVEARLNLIIRQMAEAQDITEQLKANDQMLWVQRMNNIRSCAEEIVLKELIYV